MNRDDRDPTLRSLKELDGYEVADDDPNPLGWTVATADGQQVGEVKDLVVDTTEMKVRYFDVALDEGVFEMSVDEQVLIPAQTVRLSTGDRRVIVPSNSPEELFQYIGTAGAGIASWDTTAGQANPTSYAHDLPAATLDAPTAPVDDSASRFTATDAVSRDAGDATARVTRSAEELRIGKRRVQVGEVVVHKTVETEQVHEPVTRDVERVRVERRAVEGGVTGPLEARIEGDEIRIPITEEEVIVEKRAVVKEEIVISKEVTQQTDTVDAELRHERVEIEGDRIDDPLRGTDRRDR